MKVVFISPDFNSVFQTESNLTELEKVVETFMKDRFDINSYSFIKYYSDWNIYTEKEYNLYYQGTVAEILV